MTLRIDAAAERERALTVALAALRRGEVILLPVESGYALACDAFSGTGAAAVRELKSAGPGSALPVMVGSISTVSGIAYGISSTAADLMRGFWPGLLTLMVAPQPSLAWDLPSDRPLSVRMPLHPLTLELLGMTGPLVVIGANAAGEPLPRTVDRALESLSGEPSVALDAGELTTPAAPSAIVDVRTEPAVLVRAGEISADALRVVVPDLVVPDLSA